MLRTFVDYLTALRTDIHSAWRMYRTSRHIRRILATADVAIDAAGVAFLPSRDHPESHYRIGAGRIVIAGNDGEHCVVVYDNGPVFHAAWIHTFISDLAAASDDKVARALYALVRKHAGA